MKSDVIFKINVYKINLSLGKISYLLPREVVEEKNRLSVFSAMLRLTPKSLDSEEDCWDYEIKDDNIIFSPHFIKILDFEGEETVVLNYGGDVLYV